MSIPWVQDFRGATADHVGPLVMALATSDERGHPRVRFVICRWIDDDGTLWFASDRRSDKNRQLAVSPIAEAVCWLPAIRRQFRFAGEVEILDSSLNRDASDAIWRELTPETRAMFFWPSPGLARTRPDSDITVIEDNENDLDLSSATAAAQDASIIRFVNQVMTEALEMRATDVHVEPFENQLRLRYRVDGVLVEANIPPQVRRFHAAIVSRLKILSHLDIAEKRLPQDGRIRLKVSGREIDLRVSVIPMIHGEAVVLRILDRGDALLGLEHLGMAKRDRTVWERVIELPHGIILVTGPTGSGKTTSLYAALSRINTTDLKIVTIEDPVEYQLRGINQIQVNTKAGLTFGAGLRAILRHDPDVVLIGEIRDRETADIAVQASLTGHLVFSTLHTNDAPGATTRLIDMGIEPYLVASSLEMVVAQRLVRLICKQCKQESPEDLEAARAAGVEDLPEMLFRGAGCRHCQNSGYRGRQGVFELMPITEDVRTLTLERASSQRIRDVAVREGMASLREDGWRLVREGKTTVEEVLRVTKDETMNIAMTVEAPAQ